MLRSLYVLFEQYDPIYAGLAVVLCAVASITSIELFCRAAYCKERSRVVWLCIAATAGGTGLWAANFVAMLALAPGAFSGFDLGLTVLSLLIGVASAGVGFGVATIGRLQDSSFVGGAIVGAGIAAMNFAGLAGLHVDGTMQWSPALIATSLILAPVFGALSLSVSRHGDVNHQLIGALSLFFAICSHHFIATAAVTVTLDPTVAASGTLFPRGVIAAVITAIGLLILLLACAVLALDMRDRRNALLEAERLQSLANVAIEGLVICSNGRIANANRAFAKLVGSNPSSLLNRFIDQYIPFLTEDGLSACADDCVETSLHHPDGTDIPVEVIARAISYAGERHIAVAVRDVSARRRDAKQIHFLAHHDPLTKLANRTSFGKKLEQEIARADLLGNQLAVLCLDLDRFKEVNDLFGHATGDALLQRVAEVVGALLDADQMVARLGGDEFAVVTSCDRPAAAGALAERILEAFQAENARSLGPSLGTSIGIALYPTDGIEAQAILVNADTALYRAKAEGRGTFRFFEAKMGVEVRERRLLEHELRNATARGEMQIAYQPQMDTTVGQVAGFEALLRWNHPQRGPISPSVFVPLAEESDIILKLGAWVLREACAEAATWENPLSIGVNVSGIQLHRPDFADLVGAVLRDTGLEARRLELEITETALIRDPARALVTLKALKQLGVSIAMDDFGTGYSSLSNLRSFPLDRIKIDRSFIRSVDSNAQAAAIVRSVLGLGRGLGLPVVAEGVETEAELAFLKSENCESIQGYLIGRPAMVDEMLEHMQTNWAASRAAFTSGPVPLPLARSAEAESFRRGSISGLSALG